MNASMQQYDIVNSVAEVEGVTTENSADTKEVKGME